jgi:NAD(P)-dependent dehydrogenase (short-subunit alcohol dehydrogenase family)
MTEQKNKTVDGEPYQPAALELRDEESIENLVTTLAEINRLPAGLVANASARDALGPTFPELSHSEFTHLFEADVAGHAYLAWLLYSMVDEESILNSVVFLSSIYANQGVDRRIYPDSMDPTPIHYAAVKSALRGIVRTLAPEFAPETRVNSIIAGGVRSKERQKPAFVENYEAKTMLERMASPKEIADTVTFLISSQSSYVTAEELTVDGGYSSW